MALFSLSQKYFGENCKVELLTKVLLTNDENRQKYIFQDNNYLFISLPYICMKSKVADDELERTTLRYLKQLPHKNSLWCGKHYNQTVPSITKKIQVNRKFNSNITCEKIKLPMIWWIRWNKTVGRVTLL